MPVIVLTQGLMNWRLSPPPRTTVSQLDPSDALWAQVHNHRIRLVFAPDGFLDQAGVVSAALEDGVGQ